MAWSTSTREALCFAKAEDGTRGLRATSSAVEVSLLIHRFHPSRPTSISAGWCVENAIKKSSIDVMTDEEFDSVKIRKLP